MIVVSGTVQVHPEDREAAMAAAIEVGKSTRSEEGCLSYRFYADLEEPGTFRVFEEWESDEALKAHFQQPHMAVFAEKLRELRIEGRDIKRYVVGEVTPL